LQRGWRTQRARVRAGATRARSVVGEGGTAAAHVVVLTVRKGATRLGKPPKASQRRGGKDSELDACNTLHQLQGDTVIMRRQPRPAAAPAHTAAAEPLPSSRIRVVHEQAGGAIPVSQCVAIVPRLNPRRERPGARGLGEYHQGSGLGKKQRFRLATLEWWRTATRPDRAICSMIEVVWRGSRALFGAGSHLRVRDRTAPPDAHRRTFRRSEPDSRAARRTPLRRQAVDHGIAPALEPGPGMLEMKTSLSWIESSS